MSNIALGKQPQGEEFPFVGEYPPGLEEIREALTAYQAAKEKQAALIRAGSAKPHARATE